MALQKAILGAPALIVIIGLGTPASAQTCATDKDCPQSYFCVASGAAAQPLPACPPNADCAKLVDAGQIAIMTCEPKACTADMDCGAGMVCHTETAESCSGGGTAPSCAPNTKCDAGAPVMTTQTCTTTITKLCAFKWQLPCSANSDCGDGFTCAANVSITCSGSGTAGSGTATTGTGHAGTGGASSAPIDGGSAPVSLDAAPAPVRVDGGTVAVDPDAGTVSSCTTMSSFPGYCSLKVTTCATDADCPSAWKCTDVPTAVGVSSGAPTGGTASPPAATGGAPAMLADGGAAKACVSPLGGGYGYPLRGGGVLTGAPQVNGSPSANGSGGTSGTTTSTGDKAGGAAVGTGNAGPASSSSGCSLAGGGAEPRGLLLLALVVLTRARRRSR